MVEKNMLTDKLGLKAEPDYDLSRGFDALGITEEDLVNMPDKDGKFLFNDPDLFFTAAHRFKDISLTPYGYEPTEGKDVVADFKNYSEYQRTRKFDPSYTTPEEIEATLNKMTTIAAGGEGSLSFKRLVETANNRPEEYNRFTDQILHDALVKNPKLVQFFQENYPEKLDEYDQRFRNSNVTVAKTEWGTPVYAGSAYRVAKKDTGPDVSESVTTYDGEEVDPKKIIRSEMLSRNPYAIESYGLKPLSVFDKENIDTIVGRMEMSTRFRRAAYDAAVTVFGMPADFIISPREKLADLFYHNGNDWGVTPNSLAKSMNGWNRSLKKPFRNPSGMADIFSQAQLKNPNLTYTDIFGAPNTETFVDSLLGNLLGSKDERYVESDRRLTIPGGKPFGQDFMETLTGVGSEIFLFRGGAEAVKSIIRGGFWAVRKGLQAVGGSKVDQTAIRQGIQKQINSRGQLWKRVGGARYKALLNSENLGQTLYVEELLGLAAVSTVAGLDAVGFFDSIEDGTLKTGSQVGVGIFAPMLLAVAPQIIRTPFRTSVDGISGLFSGNVAQLADGKLVKNATKVERELGSLLQELKKNDPEMYGQLFAPLIEFKEQREFLRVSFEKKGIPAKEINSILEDLDTVHSSSFALSLFASARLALTQTDEATNISMSVGKRQNLSKAIEEMNKHTSIMNNESEAMEAFGSALARLTANTNKLELRGVGTSGALKDKISKIQQHFRDNILAPENIKEDVAKALVGVYDIKNRYKSALINKDTAEQELNTLLYTLDSGDYKEGVKDAVYFELLRMKQRNMGDSTNAREKAFESIFVDNKVISNYVNAETNKVIEINSIVENSGIISSTKPQEGVVPNYTPAEGIGPFGTFTSRAALRTEQRRLLSSAEEYHRTISSGKYNKALEGTEGEQTVNLGQFVEDVKNMQGGTYGFLADKQVASLLSKIVANRKKTLDAEGISTKYQEELSELFDDVASGKRASFSEEEAAEILEKLAKNFEDLTLREAIQFRSDIGKIAFNTTDRKSGVLLREVYSKFDDQIENAIPSEVSDLLKEAGTYYKDYVVAPFYDPYSKRALNDELNMDSPFILAFGGTSDPNGLSRRNLFDRMFVGTKEEEAAYLAMQGVALQRLNKTGRLEQPQALVQKLRDEVDLGNPIHFDFLDVILRNRNTGKLNPEGAAQFKVNSKTAPSVSQTPDGDFKINLTETNYSKFRENVYENSIINGSPYYAVDSNQQKNIVGAAAQRIAEAAETAQAINLSVTARTWASIAATGDKNANVGKALINVVLDADDVDAANIYRSILKDAEDALTPAEYNSFESSLRSLLSEEQFRASAIRSVAPTRIDDPTDTLARRDVDFDGFGKELKNRQELWKEIYGDEFDAVVTLTAIKDAADQGMTREALFNFGKSMNAMSETQALSRAWSVARRVVSVRYVATEFLLRQMAAGKSDIFLKILSQRGLTQRLYEGIEASAYPKYAKRGATDSIIPILAGSLAPMTGDQDYKKTLAALYNVQEYARQQDVSFEHVIFSLYLLSSSKPQMDIVLASEKDRKQGSRVQGGIRVAPQYEKEFNKMVAQQRKLVKAIGQRREREAQESGAN